jgi:NAD(P)-dependent dehydrogenase (short-subunit alcohol dehydrogenase family)
MRKLEGRVALVTGAGRGLGKAMALALAREGARLALVARSRDQLERAAAECRALGAEAEAFPADVADEAAVAQLARHVLARFSALHILINNAGVNVRKPLADFTLAEWRQVLDTNLTGPFLLCRAFVPHMKGQGFGRILNICSNQSHVGLAHRVAYGASKAGLLGFTRALALELAPEKITVVGISPGPIHTEINEALFRDPEVRRWFLERVPLGRLGRPEEVAALAVYLCTEEAGWITGSDILIDGGWCAP